MKKPRLTDAEAAILMKAAHGISPHSGDISPDVGDTSLKHHELDQFGVWCKSLWLYDYVDDQPLQTFLTDRGRKFLDEWLQSKPKP